MSSKGLAMNKGHYCLKAKTVLVAAIICSIMLTFSNTVRQYDPMYFFRSTSFLNKSYHFYSTGLSRSHKIPIQERKLSIVNNTDENNLRDKADDVCKSLALAKYKTHHRNFIVNYSHKLLYCWIHKVASSTFISFFSSLAGRHIKENYYREIKILATKSNEELETILHNDEFIKILVVRHPFDRLVSAFRDRIEDNSHFSTQAWMYGPQILAKRKLKYSEIFDRSNGLILKTVPSFKEFITWLITIAPSSYDAHWIRYYDQCVPCKIHYDIIIKLESIIEGEKIFKNITGLKKSRFSTKHLQETKHGKTTFNTSCDYFKDLKLHQLETLYKIYEPDFKKFGYSPKPYFKCSKFL